MAGRYFGAPVVRREDPRLLTGHGRYVDDITLPGMAHAVFVRSPYAHARIQGIDCAAAKAVAGVFDVLTLADFGERYADKRMAETYSAPHLRQEIRQYPLAKDEVCYVGEPVALVVAESRAIAEDAAALVAIDFAPLPAIIDCAAALDKDAPRAHAASPDNIIAQLHNAYGDIDKAFHDAAHHFSLDVRQHRGGCHAMECRGVIAKDEPYGDGLTVWSSTQSPYLVRRVLTRHLEEDDSRLRVIAPDVGGGFGPKASVYAEEIVIALAARILAMPVKWIEDRREHFTATNQQGDQIWHLDVAARDDGKMLGLRGHIIADNGAYMPYGLRLPFSTLIPLPGPYDLPALDVRMDVVFTNTTAKSPVRGAGRPNTAFAMERAIEAIARGLDLDPAAVRAANFVTTAQFPYQSGNKAPTGALITYDSGDFHGCLDKALALADYAGFKDRQANARAAGRYLGIGVSSCVEDTGRGPFEGATIRVNPSGRVLLQTGAAGQGQGHATVFAQIAADELGVDIDQIEYRSADTGQFPHGIATVGSRVAVNAGSAVFKAAREVRDKALQLAANLLQADQDELELVAGTVRAKGSDEARLTLAELATQLSPIVGGELPMGMAPGLEATAYTDPQPSTTASGTNIAEVEVDIDTGQVKLIKYSVAHDCGRLINPLLVNGQIEGGVVHGIGNALFERMYYDADGQPLSTNYGEYLLPTASEVPPIDIVHQVTPSPSNPLGIKGAGEGGTIPAAAAIIAAIENALAPWQIVIDDYPVAPQTICALLDAAEARDDT